MMLVQDHLLDKIEYFLCWQTPFITILVLSELLKEQTSIHRYYVLHLHLNSSIVSWLLGVLEDSILVTIIA